MKKLLAPWLFFKRCNGKECAADVECENPQKTEDPYSTVGQLELQQVEGGRGPQDPAACNGTTNRITTIQEDAMDGKDSTPPIFLAIQSGDPVLLDEALKETDATTTDCYAGQSPLHAACHAKNMYALTLIIQRGAKVELTDQLGRTPLHVAVDEMWHEGVAELLKSGASPNTPSEPPATVRGVRVETPLHTAVRRGDLVSTTFFLQQRPDLSLKDSEHCSILHLAAYSRNIEIISQLLQRRVCQKLLHTKDKDGNTVLHRALMKSWNPTEESIVKLVVGKLVDAGADVNATNPLGETPLHLASQQRLSGVVETLLSIGADPTLLTSMGQSVLHAACQQGCASCLTLLLQSDQVKDLVTCQDNGGYEPFHYAVQSGSIDCCELLLTNGDHLTRVTKDGMSHCSVILKHLPSATELLKRLFDANVLLSNLPQYDPDYRITFNYSVLYQDEEGVQSSLISELSNSNLEALLKHPLLESFLFFKWRTIKPFFYCTVSLYFLFLLLHTTFVIMTFGGSGWRWSEHPKEFEAFLILHIIIFFLILVPDLIIMVANFKKYLRQWETFSKAVALFSSAFVIFSYTTPIRIALESSMTQNLMDNTTANSRNLSSVHVEMLVVRRAAAISAFFTWAEFMMLLGRFPSLGSYVLMFTRVAKSIIKFLFAFSSLIIGFAVSFMVLFHNKVYFSTFPISIVKTLMMMIGEIDFGDLLDDQEMPILGCLFLVLFLFLVCILVANLLIGLAVNDIPDLQRQGKIKRLSKQASYLVSYERLMKVAQSLRCFPRQLRILMTSRCKIPQIISVMPNKDSSNKGSKSNHYSLPSETLHEAILLGTEDSKGDYPSLVEEDDIVAQFRSFKIKYARDRRQLNRRLAQLPDTDTTESILSRRLDRMELILHQQLLQLSLQLSQQNLATPVQNYTTQLSCPAQQQTNPQYRDSLYSQKGMTTRPFLSQISHHTPSSVEVTPSQQQLPVYQTLTVQEGNPAHPSLTTPLGTRTHMSLHTVDFTPPPKTSAAVFQGGIQHQSASSLSELNTAITPQPQVQQAMWQQPGTNQPIRRDQLPLSQQKQEMPPQEKQPLPPQQVHSLPTAMPTQQMQPQPTQPLPKQPQIPQQTQPQQMQPVSQQTRLQQAQPVVPHITQSLNSPLSTQQITTLPPKQAQSIPSPLPSQIQPLRSQQLQPLPPQQTHSLPPQQTQSLLPQQSQTHSLLPQQSQTQSLLPQQSQTQSLLPQQTQSQSPQQTQSLLPQQTQSQSPQQTQSLLPQQTQSQSPQQTQSQSPQQTQPLLPQQTQSQSPQQTQSLLPQQTQSLLPQQTQSLLPQHTQPLLPQQTQSVQSQHTQPLLPQQTQSVQSQHTQPLLPQQTQSVQSQHTQPLLPQQTQSVQSQHTQPLLPQSVQSQDTQPLLPQQTQQSQPAPSQLTSPSQQYQELEEGLNQIIHGDQPQDK